MDETGWTTTTTQIKMCIFNEVASYCDAKSEMTRMEAKWRGFLANSKLGSLSYAKGPPVFMRSCSGQGPPLIHFPWLLCLLFNSCWTFRVLFKERIYTLQSVLAVKFQPVSYWSETEACQLFADTNREGSKVWQQLSAAGSRRCIFSLLLRKRRFSPAAPRPPERFTACNTAYTSDIRWFLWRKWVSRCTVKHWPLLCCFCIFLSSTVAPHSKQLLCAPLPSPPSAQWQNGRESICSRHQQQRSKNLQLLPAERPYRQELRRWCGYMGPQDDKVRTWCQPFSWVGVGSISKSTEKCTVSKPHDSMSALISQREVNLSAQCYQQLQPQTVLLKHWATLTECLQCIMHSVG